MNRHCPYCSAFEKAIPDNNYCSVYGAGSSSYEGNSFYLKSDQLYSDWHISRTTFRTVLNGYQRYHFDNGSKNDKVLSRNRYLIVNEGQDYCNEIDPEVGAEFMIIAFGKNVIWNVLKTSNTKLDTLLSNDFFDFPTEEVSFFNSTNELDKDFDWVLARLKQGILQHRQDGLFYEQLHYSLAELIVHKYFDSLSFSAHLPAAKQSTRLETYKRVNLAREYMTANFDKNLTLDGISKVGLLSPFYFLKSFKAIYGQTPLQFLTTERIRYAKELLTQSGLSVNDITMKCGFENTSSFIRLFKNKVQHTPIAYRRLHAR
jgi:AraC-like DNA-binding protein